MPNMQIEGCTTPLLSSPCLNNSENEESPQPRKKKLKTDLTKKSTKHAESTNKNDIPLICGTKNKTKTHSTELFPQDCKPIIQENKVTIFLNLRTYSEAQTIAVKKKNGKYTTEHWTAKHKRHKKQKNIVFWSYQEVKQFVKYPCTLTFVRYAPKTLDAHDNLPMSQKWIVDALCAEITGEHRPGLADNFEGLTIKYDQVKSKVYGVKIIIEF